MLMKGLDLFRDHVTKIMNKMADKGGDGNEHTPLLSGAGDGDASAPQKGVEELPPPYSEGVESPSSPTMPAPEASGPGEYWYSHVMLLVGPYR